MQLLRYVCRECGGPVEAGPDPGALLTCPQHPSAVIESVIVDNRLSPAILEDEDDEADEEEDAC